MAKTKVPRTAASSAQAAADTPAAAPWVVAISCKGHMPLLHCAERLLIAAHLTEHRHAAVAASGAKGGGGSRGNGAAAAAGRCQRFCDRSPLHRLAQGRQRHSESWVSVLGHPGPCLFDVPGSTDPRRTTRGAP